MEVRLAREDVVHGVIGVRKALGSGEPGPPANKSRTVANEALPLNPVCIGLQAAELRLAGRLTPGLLQACLTTGVRTEGLVVPGLTPRLGLAEELAVEWPSEKRRNGLVGLGAKLVVSEIACVGDHSS